MNSLQNMCEQALARKADYPAFERDGEWITWGQIRGLAARVRALLETSGADRTARVALLPRNRPADMAVLIALLADARSVRMIHVHQSPSGIARDIGGIVPVAVLGLNGDFTAEVTAVLREKGIAGIAYDGMEASFVAGCERSTAPGETLASPRLELLTSGTTGTPKPFELGYDMLAEYIAGFDIPDTSATVDKASAPPTFNYIAFSTITGLYQALPALVQGKRAVLVDRFSVAAWQDFVARYRPGSCSLPPAAVQMVLEAQVPREQLSSLAFIIAGAAPLDPSVQRAFEVHYGVPLLPLYGATEFGGPVAFMTPELHAQWIATKLGSVGRPFAGALLRVVDAETGVERGSGQVGILEVMSPRLGDYWMRTSDLALIDQDGFLFIKGRADGAINRGGFKVLPDAIERALILHPAVSAAAVTALADKRLGQVPAVVVQPAPGSAQPSITELESHLRDQVAATHIPVKWRFVETLPYTAAMKIDRVALRRMFDADVPQ